jgi:Domain of unknown function (DUF4169)
MADLVDLNKYRKQRDRRDAQKTAVENRARHGRSKAERKQERLDSDKAAKDLDNKRLD